MGESLIRATSIEVEIGLILLDAQGIVFLHVFPIDRRVVLQILAIRDTQLLQVILNLGLQFLILLILCKSLVGRLLRILAMKDTQDGKHVAKSSPEQRTGRRIPCQGLATTGSTTYQQPGIRELLVLLTQLIGIFQDREQFPLGLKDIRRHTRIILARHIIEELIETIRAHLCQFQGIDDTYRLLKVIVPTRLQILLLTDSLVSRDKLIDRFIVLDIERKQIHLRVSATRHQRPQKEQ